MRVTVFGATGYTGSAVARELLRRGHDVVGVARDPSRIEAAERLAAVAGSIHDEGLRRRALDGAEAVFVALPYREVDGQRLGDVLPALLAACAEGGTRLGLIGGAGSLHVSEGGPRLVDTPEFPDAFKGEALAAADVLEALRATDADVDWFYLSPAPGFGSYAPGERTGGYRLGGDVVVGDHISAEDLAIAVADELERPAHHRRRFTVAT